MEKVSRWRQRISALRKRRGLLVNRLMNPKAMHVGSGKDLYPGCSGFALPLPPQGNFWLYLRQISGESFEICLEILRRDSIIFFRIWLNKE